MIILINRIKQSDTYTNLRMLHMKAYDVQNNANYNAIKYIAFIRKKDVELETVSATFFR